MGERVPDNTREIKIAQSLVDHYIADFKKRLFLALSKSNTIFDNPDLLTSAVTNYRFIIDPDSNTFLPAETFARYVPNSIYYEQILANPRAKELLLELPIYYISVEKQAQSHSGIILPPEVDDGYQITTFQVPTQEISTLLTTMIKEQVLPEHTVIRESIQQPNPRVNVNVDGEWQQAIGTTKSGFTYGEGNSPHRRGTIIVVGQLTEEAVASATEDGIPF